jgi:hypothetical protein
VIPSICGHLRHLRIEVRQALPRFPIFARLRRAGPVRQLLSQSLRWP